MFLYRLILCLIAPLVILRLLWRRSSGRETWTDIGERLGFGSGSSAGQAVVWLHGASVGELTSARPLVDAMRAARPDLDWVVTANTVTGRNSVLAWKLPGVSARLSPLDFRLCLWRFRQSWAPRAYIFLENEIWPNRMATNAGPMVAVGARMSGKSAARWARFPRLAQRLLGRISLIFPQDTASAEHFARLGVDAARIGTVGTLKSAVTLPPPDPVTLTEMQKVYARAATLLAASTHEGEEEVVLDAFSLARKEWPELKLILAPRHPDRGDKVARLLDQRGLQSARRSAGGQPTGEIDVYLADTLGEMPLWYTLAGITFIGGTLAPKGGHTPYEPAAAGSAIIFGPDTANFRAPFAALSEGGAAIQIHDASGLSNAVLALRDSASQADMSERANRVLISNDAGADHITDIAERLNGLF